MTSDGSVIGVYGSIDEAEAAVKRLDADGFPIGNVSIVARDLTAERSIRGFVSTGDGAKEGASIGGWVGGILGVMVGAALVWVPGFGPLLVAGPLAAMILGGIEGAAVGVAGGGVLGALIGWGVSREHVLKYEDHLVGGRYLVIANGSQTDVAAATDILSREPHVALERHGANAAGGMPMPLERPMFPPAPGIHFDPQ